VTLIGFDGDETAYPFRADVGQQYGYDLPETLALRLVAAEQEHDAVTTAIREHIAEQRLPLLDLDTGEEADEDDL
jgi:hypothetical protein